MASFTPRPLPTPDRLGFSSLAVHAGERLPAFDTKPVTSPICGSVAFEAPSAAALDEVFEGTRPGYCYTRHGNPTCEALEETLTRLERGAGAIAFASGMAALHAAVLTAGAGSGFERQAGAGNRRRAGLAHAADARGRAAPRTR